MNEVTPLVLTFNEAPNLDRTLGALRWAARVVVLDSGSTDETAEIAHRFPNVDVVHRAFDAHAAQWNFGLAQLRTPWALTLDADYIVPPAFVEEMRRALERPEADGYRAPFRYCIGGRPLRGALYPPRIVLFRRDRARYVQDGHTQALDLDGVPGTLQTPIFHDDRKPLSRWLANQAKYAALEADKLLATPLGQLGRADRLRLRKLAPLVVPFYCLLARRLVLDGRAGLEYTLQRTYAEVLLALELSERARRS